MAKLSRIIRNEKRLMLIKKFAKKRALLKSKGDYKALDKIPKNASVVRYRNRCRIDGRPRGFIRKFGISRISFRELASFGLLPGVRKVD